MTKSDLARWMITYVAVLIGEPSENLSLDTALSDFDFDSIDAVNMALELEQTLQAPVDPEIFLDGQRSLRDALDQISQDFAEA